MKRQEKLRQFGIAGPPTDLWGLTEKNTSALNDFFWKLWDHPRFVVFIKDLQKGVFEDLGMSVVADVAETVLKPVDALEEEKDAVVVSHITDEEREAADKAKKKLQKKGQPW